MTLHDKLSRCNWSFPYSAENAISARNDLNPKKWNLSIWSIRNIGPMGTDMKVTNSKMVPRLSSWLLMAQHMIQQPVLSGVNRTLQRGHTPYYGHPDVWKFPVVGQMVVVTNFILNVYFVVYSGYKM